MRRILSFALPAALLLAGCVPYNVRYDYDSRADFKAYRTFDWYAGSAKARDKGKDVTNPLMDKRVRYAIERELQGKGLKREGSADPDLLVTYYPIYRERAYRTTTHMGWGWGFRPWGMGLGTSVSSVHHYQEGTIVIELVDFKTNEIVWHAAAEGALTNLGGDPEEIDEQVGRAVQRMLTEFPPSRRK